VKNAVTLAAILPRRGLPPSGATPARPSWRRRRDERRDIRQWHHDHDQVL